MPALSSLPTWTYWALGAGILAVFVLILFFMDRPAICPCGSIKLWHSGLGDQSSQHLFDWYTFSHVIHGFLLYGLLSLCCPRMPRAARIVIAIIPEVAWEVVENTPYVIEYYRTQTAAAQYVGDTIINSLMDVVAMIAGAIYARFYPIWTTVVMTIFLELLALWVIRDNLTLNILMFIHPFELIKEWQSAR